MGSLYFCELRKPANIWEYWYELVPALIGVQDEDSCGKSGQCETPQGGTTEEAYGPPAESEVLHENQKRRCRTLLIPPTSRFLLLYGTFETEFF
jgi:hypothetical protein